MTKKEDKVYQILSQIETTLEKQNSAKQIFWQGLVRGLGTALGATVLVALVTSFAVQFLDVVDVSNFLQYFFTSTLQE